VQLVWSGFESADGIVGAPDGSLLFVQQVSNRVRKIDNDGKVSSCLEDRMGPVRLRSTNKATSLT